MRGVPDASREAPADVSAENVALGAGEVRALLERIHDAFARHRDEIDELNVFPVPDGDTGTNLLLTVRTALDGAERPVGRDPGGSGGDAVTDPLADAETLARGTVMGARGNSGVILSQVVRALVETVRDRGRLDTGGLADWLDRARAHAYEAVADPVEGTMLTAVRVAADRARRAAHDGDDLRTAVAGVAEAVSAAVARTPEQLDVLREAGVVDAGARGFEVLCDVLDRLVRGEPSPSADRPPPIVERDAPVVSREVGSLEFRFEVQYLLRAPDGVATELRERLERLGDSVVVSGIGDLLNVHVHTNEIGAAIEEGVTFGTPSRIQVTSFADQVADDAEEGPGGPDAGGGSTARGTTGGPASADGVGDGEIGCVAVVAGDGLRELVEAQGAAAVDGAAGDLPSVATLLNGIGRSGGGAVAVLPGHPNIVPTARQAAEVSRAEGGREILVVESAVSPPRVLAALAVWDADGEAGAVLGGMEEAAASGASGEVVAAVRDARTPFGSIVAGDHLALRDGEVIACDPDPVEALTALARACRVADAEVVSLIVGADVGDDECERAVAALEELAPDVDLEVIDGRHRPARFHLGVE